MMKFLVGLTVIAWLLVALVALFHRSKSSGDK